MSAHFLAVEVELECQSSAELSSLLLMPRTLDSASVDVPQPEARRKNQQENASSRAGWGCHGKIGLSHDAESSEFPSSLKNDPLQHQYKLPMPQYKLVLLSTN
jgi:hypothetical protein